MLKAVIACSLLAAATNSFPCSPASISLENEQARIKLRSVRGNDIKAIVLSSENSRLKPGQRYQVAPFDKRMTKRSQEFVVIPEDGWSGSGSLRLKYSMKLEKVSLFDGRCTAYRRTVPVSVPCERYCKDP